MSDLRNDLKKQPVVKVRQSRYSIMKCVTFISICAYVFKSMHIHVHCTCMNFFMNLLECYHSMGKLLNVFMAQFHENLCVHAQYALIIYFELCYTVHCICTPMFTPTCMHISCTL